MQIFAVLIGILSLICAVFAWQISKGPISLPQLASFIEANANKNSSGIEVKISGVSLSWQGWERYLDLRLIETEILSKDGQKLALLPETSISLSPVALMDGIIAPRHVEIFNPKIELVRHADGSMSFEMEQGSQIQTEQNFKLSEILGRAPDPDKPQSYLKQISVHNGKVTFVDEAKDFKIYSPDTSVVLNRTGDHLILGTNLEADVQKKQVSLGLVVDYDLNTDLTEVAVDIDQFPLEMVARFDPKLSQLNDANVPIKGHVKIWFEKNFSLKSLFVDLKSENGNFSIPEPASQKLQYVNSTLKLTYENLDKVISVDEFSIDLADKTYVNLPAPLNHDMPVSSMRFIGEMDAGNDLLKVRDLVIDLGEGPVATLSADIGNIINGPNRSIDMVGEVLNVETSNLYRYWPVGLNDDARDWVTGNLSDGIVPRAGINLSIVLGDEGTAQINHVFGDMEMEGISVNYLKPLPQVRNAKGWAKYTDKEFNITVTGGEVGEMKVTKGQLDITGFELYDQTMNVDLTVEGPLRDTLEFIDLEPLGFASALDLDPKKTDGFASTNLKLEFLLLDDLKMDDVAVEANAMGRDVVIEDVFLDQDLSDGNLKLRVDNVGMDLTGEIVLGSIPANLVWRENFTKDTLFQSRYVIAGTLNNEQRANELNLDFAPFTPEYINGDVGVNVTVTQSWDDLGKLDAFVDLKGAEINIPGVYWTKSPDQTGEAYVNLSFNTEQIINVPYFSVLSNDLEASGSVKLSPNGEQLQTLVLSRFKAGRTDITQATVLYSEQSGWQVDAFGPSLDLQAALNQDRSSASEGQSDTDIKGTLSARFDKVWVAENHHLNSLAGAITSDGEIWTQAHLTGQVGSENQQFVLDISPFEDNRRLIVKTLDAGSLLKNADVFENMLGGELRVTATFNDQLPNRPLDGLIEINDFRILDVPLLARVLNLAGLTGILDSLSGGGIGFNSLTAPFQLADGVVTFKDGRTNGVSLGLTWEGQMNLDTDVADINGTVVPMFLLNSALGRVPVIGQIFSAGEKGGGLFAWTYDIEGQLDEADVKINPISGLAPGFFRKIFESTETENAQAN